MTRRPELVAVGSSKGGLRALSALLGGLPADFPAAVAIVQHRGAETEPGPLPGLLGRASALPVHEAEDGDPLEPGHVYLAPPDYHLLVEPGALRLSVDEEVSLARPSIDLLFVSASEAYGAALVAVLLTGAGDDGADGLVDVRRRGGTAVVQDPAEAEVAAMPAAGLAAAGADAVLPLAEIPAHLVSLCCAEPARG